MFISRAGVSARDERLQAAGVPHQGPPHPAVGVCARADTRKRPLPGGAPHRIARLKGDRSMTVPATIVASDQMTITDTAPRTAPTA